MTLRFPVKKNAGWPKALRDLPPRKDDILLPRWVALGHPFPSPRVCTDVSTLSSQPKYFVSIGYQISLLVVLRAAAFGRKGAQL